jgi:hypothetical protein
VPAIEAARARGIDAQGRSRGHGLPPSREGVCDMTLALYPTEPWR